MKVLAIRAANLTSLERFELDLSAGPLAETRIFAITGPTGAGKSTILDAMCLALYDRAPRVVGARETALGELEVAASDPRSLVRRGATEATCEVDFETDRGGRFRAIWEVWRARRRPDGRLQSPRMRLVDLETQSEVGGATKTETLARIEAEVGLGYAEFRRAVLLAQNDFASFLDARADERAELLERMTGTEIYAAVSRAAFARAKLEEERLRELEAEESRARPLDDDARSGLEAERAESSAQRQRAERDLQRVLAAITWHEDLRRLEADLADAAGDVALAQAALEAAVPGRRALTRAIEAERLRPQLESKRRSEASVRAAEVALGQSLAEREAAVTALEAACASAAERGASLEAARAAAQAIAPEVERARRLDAELQPAARARDDARLRDAEAHAILDGASGRAAALASKEAEQQAARAAVGQALAAKAAIVPLAAEWPRWRAELARLSSALEGEAEAHKRKASAAEREVRSRAEEEEARAVLLERERHAEAARDAAQAAKRQLDARRADAPPRALREAAERLGHELASIEAMTVIAAEARRAEKTLGDTTRFLATEERLLRREERAELELTSKIAELELSIAAAERDLIRAQAAVELAARRRELLVDGEPCPLCGSCTHPSLTPQGAEAEPEAAQPLDRARDRLVKQHARAVETLESKRRSRAAREDALARARSDSSALLDRVARGRTELRERRRALELAWLDSPILARLGVNRVALLVPSDPSARSAPTDLENAKRLLESHRATVLGELDLDDVLAHALEAKREARDRAEQERDARLAEAQRRAEATQAAAREGAEADLAIEAARARRAESLAELAGPLAGRLDWEGALLRDPAAFTATLEGEVRALERRTAERTTLDAELARLATELGVVRAEVAHARARAEEAERARAEAEARTAELDAERAVLLGGRPVEDVLLDQSEALALAERAAHDARALVSARSADVAARDAELRGAEARLREERARLEVETARLGDALREAGLEDEAALAEQSRTPDWIEAARRELEALDAWVARAETTRADRDRRLAAHRASGAPHAEGPGIDALRAEREALSRALEAEIERGARLDVALARDDAIREVRRALAPQIEAQRERLTRWAEMNQLIGSADGKKLRTFAQGLTLDALLVQANAHLEELRPRYRLRRVRGADLDIEVVDGDMGDEVRSASTLSGGERFLASLALALALSTIAARDVRIRSLFVDEGFGSLDPEALELALSVLDRLQASGRTVGIISHVPQIAERIGYQVEVKPVGPGRSEVRVLSA